MKKPHLNVVLFFFLMFIGLFLGDGKQGVVEVFGGTVVLVLWGVRWLRGGIIARLPKKLFLSWCGVFLAAFISTIFSDSIGFSISWWVRLLSGYLIYRLFYDASSDEIIEVFIKGSVVFTLAASVFGAITYTSPWFRAILPSMNLFSLTYGHNHLADILVFAAPLLFWMILKDQELSWVKAALFTGYCVMLFITFARGAWVLVGAYSIYEYITAKEMCDKKRMLKTVAIFFVVIAVGILALFVYKNRIAHERLVLRPQSVVSRLEYWRQAVEGLKERPIFGHGPGTFSLVSTRFQKLPGSASWFAHSEPLQIAAEMGFVGVIVFVWLYFVHAQLFRLNRGQIKHSKTSRVLIYSILLTLGYSLFEFTLDYFILWLLFWATVGVLTRKLVDGDSAKQHKENSIQISLVIIGIFYFLWVGSNTVSVITRRHDVAFYIAPFDLVNSLAFFESSRQTPLNKMSLQLVKIFHKKNPAILFALKDLKNNSKEEVVSYCNDSTLLDPKNIAYHQECLVLALKIGDVINVENVLKKLGKEFLPRIAHVLTEEVSLFSDLSVSLSELDISNISPRQRPILYIAKLYYMIGTRALGQYPLVTKRSWTIARRTYPDMGLLYHESASLEFYVLNNAAEARRIIDECMGVPRAALHCKQLRLDFSNVPPPGYVSQDIIQYQE